MNRTPVHSPDHALFAAVRGTLNEVRAALAAGGNVHAVDGSGNTPLIVAAYWNRDPNVARCLIDAGASVNRLSQYGAAPMHGFARNDQSELIELAANSGCPVDVADTTGCTPLIAAVAHNSARAMKTLLACGAQLEHEDSMGDVALDFATSSIVAELLVGAGQDIDRIDRTGKTALMKAAWNDNLAALQALLSCGASRTLRNTDGYMALNYVRSPEAVGCLVRAGAPVEAQGAVSPLITCVLHGGQPATLLALLAAGAALEARALSGRTALRVAAELGNVKLFALLLDAGADPSTQTNDGTGLDTAMKHRPKISMVYDSWRAQQAMRQVLGDPVGMTKANP